MRTEPVGSGGDRRSPNPPHGPIWLKQSRSSNPPANTFTIRYLSSSEEGGDARERWPCSQIKWLCRHDQGKFLGRVIFEQAAYTAQRVTEFQGNVALVIEPFDDTIAKILESKLKFLRRADQGQLWIPLHRDADLSFAATDE